MNGSASEILTIGHSTRPRDEFIKLLKANGVTKVIDIRTVPRSRHNPQYNKDTLPGALSAAGIGYTHMAGLGGLRRPRPDSPNTGWRNASFRGFADYMQTGEFEASLRELIELAGKDRVAIMCAEAVPWRCHRLLISDALHIRGICVEHIISETSRQPHELTPWARVADTHITYPPPVEIPSGSKSL